jgi:hypothetical protein
MLASGSETVRAARNLAPIWILVPLLLEWTVLCALHNLCRLARVRTTAAGISRRHDAQYLYRELGQSSWRDHLASSKHPHPYRMLVRICRQTLWCASALFTRCLRGFCRGITFLLLRLCWLGSHILAAGLELPAFVCSAIVDPRTACSRIVNHVRGGCSSALILLIQITAISMRHLLPRILVQTLIILCIWISRRLGSYTGGTVWGGATCGIAAPHMCPLPAC